MHLNNEQSQKVKIFFVKFVFTIAPFLFFFVTACSDTEDIKQTKLQDVTPADCVNVEIIKDNKTATHLQKECNKLIIRESRYEKSSEKKWSID